MDQPELGKLIGGPVGRDAVHVPVFPAVCEIELSPGDKVLIVRGERGPERSSSGAHVVRPALAASGKYDAVADPFLGGVVPPLCPFYALLRPGAVTGLRHVYTHPALAPSRPNE